MSKLKIKTPFFVFNPKTYLYGEELLNLANLADQLAKKYNITIFVTMPSTEIARISSATNNIVVTAQHIDGISPGRGMGHVLPEAVVNAGGKATFLNHAEKPLEIAELVKAINKADELGIITIVCADSLQEANAIAKLNPDIILCEPTELIGSGETSDSDYIKKTNIAIKETNESILIMQAAGISDADDVYNVISLGADGTGCTSGIVKANNPKAMFEDMVKAAINATKK